MAAWLAAAAVAFSQPPCQARLCDAQALAPVLARMAAGRPVHILQIGDSHTAGDAITGPWRARLQARYGHGGRGVLAAGRPYDGYRTWGVTASQSGGWRVNGLLGRSYRPNGPALGLSGFTQTASGPGETLGIAADAPDQMFDRLTVCALGAGTIVLRLGAMEESWPLADRPECRTLDSEAPAMQASVTSVGDGPVSIASLAAFRRAGGLVLSNLGAVGARLASLDRSDDEVVRTELAAYRPDLVILAFGTNEGFAPDLDLDAYAAGLADRIRRLRALAGTALPILLLGPPDAAVGPGGCAPPMLGQVRARQRAVAQAEGAAFWDWSATMGGSCAAARWAGAGWMRPDFVHFTREGGERIAAALDADFDRAGDNGH